MPASLLASLTDVLPRVYESDRIVLALDFDGTLAPIVEHPEMAAIPEETSAALRGLAATGRVQIIVLSGRALPDLQSRVGLDCILVGNHGLQIDAGGDPEVHQAASALRPAIECICADCKAALEGVGGVLIEDKGFTATVHYRSVPEELFGWVEATMHLLVRPYAPWLTLKPARKAWEIRPRLDWTKGSALRYLLERMPDTPLVICAGDDVTDEDMFRAVPEGVSIQVGGRIPTSANYTVESPAALARFFALLPEALQPRHLHALQLAR